MGERNYTIVLTRFCVIAGNFGRRLLQNTGSWRNVRWGTEE